MGKYLKMIVPLALIVCFALDAYGGQRSVTRSVQRGFVQNVAPPQQFAPSTIQEAANYRVYPSVVQYGVATPLPPNVNWNYASPTRQANAVFQRSRVRAPRVFIQTQVQPQSSNQVAASEQSEDGEVCNCGCGRQNCNCGMNQSAQAMRARSKTKTKSSFQSTPPRPAENIDLMPLEDLNAQ